MNRIFADTVYYLALTNPRDQYAGAATRFTAGFSGAFVTATWVLTEVANSLTRGADRDLFVEERKSLEPFFRPSGPRDFFAKKRANMARVRFFWRKTGQDWGNYQ